MILLKVTKKVSLASNPRPLWQVRKRPKKAKTYSQRPALEVGLVHRHSTEKNEKGQAFYETVSPKVRKSMKVGTRLDSSVCPNIASSLELKTKISLMDV